MLPKYTKRRYDVLMCAGLLLLVVAALAASLVVCAVAFGLLLVAEHLEG